MSNHNYERPEKGSTDWHEPLNRNFERLDRDVEIRDEEENLQEYEPEQGAKFLATDTGAVYVGTGADGWRQLHSIGVDPGTPGAREWVRYVETAAEIQPAIDALAEPNDDGSQGGVVKLGPGVYEPTTTIWLKAGVTLEGVSRTGGSNRRNMNDLQGTVITTSNLGSEPTYHHNGDDRHPHLPVVANYRTPPLELADREPTEAEKLYWGDDVGLRNVTIRATDQRWSDDDTYFGVYDACIFSRSTNLFVENVQTAGFLGYGGFFAGCKNVRDLGSVWRGGATDYHCAALTIHDTYAPEAGIRTENAVWDVAVEGPAPAIHIDNATVGNDDQPNPGIRFVSGGWAHDRDAGQLPMTTITAEERIFLGDEDDYWAGHAPIVSDPDGEGRSVVYHASGAATFDGYNFRAAGGANDDLAGVHDAGGGLRLENVVSEGADVGYRGAGGAGSRLIDCRLRSGSVGIDAVQSLPTVNRLDTSAETGIRFGDGSVAVEGTLDAVEFRGQTAIGGTDPPARVYLNYPDVRRVDTIRDGTFGNVTLQNPVGESGGSQ